jgi:hypothetical protein
MITVKHLYFQYKQLKADANKLLKIISDTGKFYVKATLIKSRGRTEIGREPPVFPPQSGCFSFFSCRRFQVERPDA